MSRRAVAGQTQEHILAREFNNWQTVSDAYQSGGLGSPPGGGLSGNLQPGLVRVKNNTLTDYPSMSILGIDDVLIKPENAEANFKTNQQTVLVCGELDPQKHVGKWVFLRDPIAAGNIGWAYESGIFPVKIRFDNANDYGTVRGCEVDFYSEEPEIAALIAGGGGAEILYMQDSAEWVGNIGWAVIRKGLQFTWAINITDYSPIDGGPYDIEVREQDVDGLSRGVARLVRGYI